MDIKKIRSLATQRRYDEALSQCDDLLAAMPEDEIEIIRTRAYIYSLIGDREKELIDRKTILESGEEMLKDYYLAGDNAIALRDFELATSMLEIVVKLGREQNESWFDSAAFFLLAYAQMELGNYEEATNNLDNAIALEPNCSMPLPGMGMLDHTQLRKEIIRKKNL